MSDPVPEELIRAAWERARPSVQGRVRSLQAFVAGLEGASPSSAELEHARTEAHRLAGSLGSYGLGDGTSRARDVESLLEADALDARGLASAVAELAATVARGPGLM